MLTAARTNTQRRISDLEWQINYALLQLKRTRNTDDMTVQPLAEMKARAESELATLRA